MPSGCRSQEAQLSELCGKEGSPADIQSILEEDPDHFNDIPYDDVVEGITHILLISACLYTYGKERTDEEGDRAKYSRVKGVHTLPMGSSCESPLQPFFQLYGRCCSRGVARLQARR